MGAGGGLVQIPNCCKTKPASRMRDRRSGRRESVPTRPPSCPSRVAYNKVQICPADQSFPLHLSPRANSLQATKRCLGGHTLKEVSAKEFKSQAINLQAADSHAQHRPPLRSKHPKHTTNQPTTTKAETGRHLPSGAPALFPE